MTHEVKTVTHHPDDPADSPSTIGLPIDQPPCASTWFPRFDPSQPQSDNDATANVLVTVLMPCLNEARTLAACIEQAHAGCQAALAQRAHHATPTTPSLVASNAAPGLTYEILIADNGSTDGSREIAVANDARVVHVERKGYGAALHGGIAAARGKYVVMGDSDCSYDFGEVPRFLDKLEEGYDLVMGNRFAGGIMPGAMPWHHRYIGNPILSGLGRLLYRTPCRDWHCGLRAFDREKIQALNLKAPGMEFASEMIVLASREQIRVSEIPIMLRPDGRDRPPHLRSIRDGMRHLRVIVLDNGYL
jgi:glycosyltransferase involved in cell wall biosynthesis